MLGLLDNAVHVCPKRAARSLLVAVLIALAPEGSNATLKAKLSADAHLAVDGQEAVRAGTLQVGEATVSENVEFLTKTLSRFKSFALNAQHSVEERHQTEEKRLQEAVSRAKDPKVKAALEQSVTSNKESLDETKGIYSNIATFSDSMLSLLSKTSTGYNCDQLTCGLHASCAETLSGASCVCDEGYIGQGKDCKAPAAFAPHLLLSENAVHASDLHVAAFDSNKIAIVFRDQNKANAGALVVGTVEEAGTVELSPVEFFTAPGASAFSPVVAGSDSKSLAIAWRDGSKSGTCRLRAAVLGASGIRGAEMALTWGPTLDFCNDQAHKMSIQGFDKNQFVVLYSDKVRAGDASRAESFGNSLLADVGASGNISVLGNFRFTDSAVTRLEATKVSQNGFVLAARASPAVDEMNPQPVKQEAMAMYGELVGEDLVFDPNPVNLEPKEGQIWARGISLVAPNTLAYAYQDGKNSQLKVAVLDLHPQTHRMQVAQAPVALAKGFSPYVSMLSMPYSTSDPYAMTYFQGDDGNSLVNICGLDAEHKLQNCEDFPWLSQKASSVAGTTLGEGRVLMAFTTPSGVPYYSLFGLSKK